MKSIAIAVCVVVLLSSISSGQAGAGWPSAWSHAYISRVADTVFITYVRSDACIDQKIEPDQVRPFPLSTLSRTESIASAETVTFAHAVTRLGSQGWQIIGEGAAYCHTDMRKALHFKRALY